MKYVAQFWLASFICGMAIAGMLAVLRETKQTCTTDAQCAALHGDEIDLNPVSK